MMGFKIYRDGIQVGMKELEGMLASTPLASTPLSQREAPVDQHHTLAP